MADKQLTGARREFVARVGKEVLVQMLDDLLEDRVVNEGEKDAIVEENRIVADRARCLIDAVRKRGPKASEKFISRLQERDPGLCELLNLGPPSAPPAAMEEASPPLPQQEASAVSPVLIHSTEQFKRDLLQREGHSIYPLKEKGQRKRLALLINNVNFDCQTMLRCGAEKDEENMEKLLKALDYTVETHRNLSAKAIDEAVKKFSEHQDHLASDSTFVVIMSHGKRDAICGTDYIPHEKDELFPIDNIFTHLNTKNCPGLRNKPKVIVIQACRGDERGYVLVSDSVPEPTALEDDGIRKELQEKDFICIMSSTPGTKAYRDVEKGAILIQKLVETINTHAHKDPIEELFRKVRKQFEDSRLQMPAVDRMTLVNKFYLFPGL